MAEQNSQDEVLGMITSQFEALKVLDGKSSISCALPTPNNAASHYAGFNEANRNGMNGNNFWGTNSENPILRQLKKLTSNGPDLIDAGKIVSKDMLKYDLHQRNAMYEEIHGVRSLCPEETPELLSNTLFQLEKELDALPQRQKTAYVQSQEYPDTYVNRRDVRLRFLRAELFNPAKAATRMAQFLDNTRDFFGPHTLKRPIRLSDFTRKELKVFHSGRLQLLPFRDRGGRRVIVGMPTQHHNSQHPNIRVKIHLYLWWVASESVESQRKGMIHIAIHNYSEYSDGSEREENPPSNDPEEVSGLPSMAFAKNSLKRSHGLPMRSVSFHCCTPDTPFFTLFRSITSLMLGENRVRLKMHVGHDLENRYKLNGYGIPLDQLPVTETGKIKMSYFKKWVQLRKNIENENPLISERFQSIVECPGLMDVVFRPSQSTMCHPGNVNFRSLVESKHYEHDMATTREEKMEITKGVIHEIKKRGGRFLVWDNNTWWTVLDDEKQIYSKIAIFFRNSKASLNAKANRQTARSSTYMFVCDTVRSGGEKRRKISGDDDGSMSSDEGHRGFNCNGFVHSM